MSEAAGDTLPSLSHGADGPLDSEPYLLDTEDFLLIVGFGTSDPLLLITTFFIKSLTISSVSVFLGIGGLETGAKAG